MESATKLGVLKDYFKEFNNLEVKEKYLRDSVSDSLEKLKKLSKEIDVLEKERFNLEEFIKTEKKARYDELDRKIKANDSLNDDLKNKIADSLTSKHLHEMAKSEAEGLKVKYEKLIDENLERRRKLEKMHEEVGAILSK